MAQGQRIYTLTSANASELNNITIDSGVRNEIQQALAQGLEVTVHQSSISVNGWTGSGYSVIDAEYGVGAYKISGGSSGGFLSVIFSTLGGFFDGHTYWENAIDDEKADAAKKAGTAAKFLTFVSVALALDSFLTNPNLGSLVELLFNLIGIILGNASGTWLVTAFGTAASPIFVGLLVAMWAFALATFMLILTDYLVSGINSASSATKKKEITYA